MKLQMPLSQKKMSKKEILDYYPAFRHMDDISAMASHFFQDFELKCFGHLTVWPEGKFSVVCNKHDCPLEFVYMGMPPVGFSAYDHITDKVIFPSMNNGSILAVPDEMVILAKERFNIINPMVIFRKYDDHYETFIFDIHTENAYNKYHNNFELFENFIHYYKDKARKIIEEANKRPIFIESQYLPSNNNPADLCYHDENCTELRQLKKYYLRHNGKDITVSGKEYYCLCLLAHGKQLKSIAKELGISLRTVETYFERIKTKLNLSTRDELVTLYWDNRILPL